MLRGGTTIHVNGNRGAEIYKAAICNRIDDCRAVLRRVTVHAVLLGSNVGALRRHRAPHEQDEADQQDRDGRRRHKDVKVRER